MRRHKGTTAAPAAPTATVASPEYGEKHSAAHGAVPGLAAGRTGAGTSHAEGTGGTPAGRRPAGRAGGDGSRRGGGAVGEERT
ncbi:hypothetical protein [Streptomyces sudanensis]|uniref:hypothetical protein n=1 Tax=Streptomyces sudanensis TaxID=436397 RepID=UPI0020CCB578|nr:hypothetical protein [Streptomyces sudanensis]MCP9958428.1 hypothetical protein [Streptomyces sudanensis]MCQ0001057.1 hypothetical protein [Streptomyces sudanensis]